MAALVRCPYPRCRQRLRIPKGYHGSVCCPRCRRFVVIDGSPVKPAASAHPMVLRWFPLVAGAAFLALIAGSTAFFILRHKAGDETRQTASPANVGRRSDSAVQPRSAKPVRSSPRSKSPPSATDRPNRNPDAPSPRRGSRIALLDRHALEAPPEVEGSVAELAEYLRQPVQSDWEAARVIYRWVTDRISYDAEAFFRGRAEPISVATVLERRKCVCAGYSALFAALGKQLGLEVVVVNGKAIGAVQAPRGRNDHAWNAVKIDGHWRLVDATWGAGVLEGKQYVKRFTDTYFLIEPERLIYSHFPDDPRWQLLDPPLTPQEFERLPRVSRSLLSLFGRLPSPREVLREPKGYQFAEAFNVPGGGRIQMLQGPAARKLKSGMMYSFRVAAPKALKIVAINNDRWHFLTRRGEEFSGRFQFDPGRLKVAAKLGERDTTYWSIVHYQVRE